MAVSAERVLERGFPRFKAAPQPLRLALVAVWLSATTTLFMQTLRAGGFFHELQDMAGYFAAHVWCL